MEEVFKMQLCKSISYGLEDHSNEVSITKASERLDFRSLLQRAAAGIIDLRAFEVPRSADISGGFQTFEEVDRATDELLNRPNSVEDNLFGASVEDVHKEYDRHMAVARANRKPKPKPEESKPEESKPEESKPEESKPA